MTHHHHNFWGRGRKNVILHGMASSPLVVILLLLVGGGVLHVGPVEGAISGYKDSTPTQYHIQTDEGKERFFRFQTYNGQYRKERRLDDGTVIGSYGWVDPTGYLRMTDYIADSKGYRVLKNSMQFVGTNSILPEEPKKPKIHHLSKQTSSNSPLPKKIGFRVPLGGKTLFKVVKKRIISYDPSPSASTPTADSVSHRAHQAPVLIVYGPLRSANVRNGKVATRRRRPQGLTVESAEETVGDVFGKYQINRPIRPRTPGSAFVYRIPEQFHREESTPQEGRLGSFGYVDPFGIRRVIHYTANNATGFTAQRDFKFVGRRRRGPDDQEDEVKVKEQY
ncbi:uncharacterized protein LOC110848481 [Folsomia candida]|uniref:Cuticle protein 6 n=1 Tax=Folsomia candida TaxID=158441 RepID=A0A226ED24_FOLCA|nr:uncharacterized protein LOC110848481 [Folsomia candida]OXA55310.1 Cuticle protein 6 [Folsomia candida]